MQPNRKGMQVEANAVIAKLANTSRGNSHQIGHSVCVANNSKNNQK